MPRWWRAAIELLQLADAALVVDVRGVPALGRVEVHRDVAPVVIRARLVVIEVLDREQLHMRDAQFGEVIEAGLDRVVVRQVRARLREAEVFAFVLDRNSRRW